MLLFALHTPALAFVSLGSSTICRPLPRAVLVHSVMSDAEMPLLSVDEEKVDPEEEEPGPLAALHLFEYRMLRAIQKVSLRRRSPYA